MSRKSFVRRRRNLLRTHPYCHWCGRKVVWYHVPGGHRNEEYGKLPDNFATMDHIYSKNEGPRPEVGILVLSCLKCNHDRGVADSAISQIRQELSMAIRSVAPEDLPERAVPEVDHLTYKISDYLT